MAERIFIKVVGFGDVERHALNTIFRLSEERELCYAPWEPGSNEAPRLLLLDGNSYEGRLEAESPQAEGLQRIWIGEGAPEGCACVFERPIAWPEVVQAMDGLFAPAPAIDFDLDFGETVPPEPQAPSRRALIASADRDERLYLRAKLALADLPHADEAESAAEALELMRGTRYDVALVDFALPGGNGWAFVKALAQARPAVGQVILTKGNASVADRVLAWSAGAAGFFDKPPHPGKLQSLLQKV